MMGRGFGIWTQSRVTAQQGGSVSIPCRYDQKYKDSVKYWCRGVLWPTCIVLQRTNSPQRRAGLSITDDPAQQVFTVTMSRLQLRDSNKYWCAVEIKGVDTPDPKAGVFLTVTRGNSSLRTTSATIAAEKPPQRTTPSTVSSGNAPPQTQPSENPPPQTAPSGVSTVMSPTEAPPFDRPTAGLSIWTQSRRTNSPQRRAGLSITDDPAQQVFTVTMSRLQLRDSNKYWCAVEIKGVDTPDPKAGVFLTVTKGTATEPTTPSTLSTGNPPSASTSSSKAAEKPPQRLTPSTRSAENPPPQTTPTSVPTVMSPTEAPPFDRPSAGLSIWTQSRVTAQQGGSVSIPCRYDQKYKDSVKYWCRGIIWPTCIVLQKTNSPQRRAGLSITDDPAQQVFTVTMSRLQLRDSNKYWCAVEIKGVDTPDPKAGVFLTVTRGTATEPTTPSTLSTGNPPSASTTSSNSAEKPPQRLTPSTLSAENPPPQTTPTSVPTVMSPTEAPPFDWPTAGLSIWTQSRVTAQQGGSVSIPCRYDQKYKDSVKYWCRGIIWPTCIVLQKTNSPQRRAGLSITDDPAQQVFTVTMSRLQLRDTNKYWCAVEIKGVDTPDPKAGVFLTVTRALASSTTQTVASTEETSPPAGIYTGFSILSNNLHTANNSYNYGNNPHPTNNSCHPRDDLLPANNTYNHGNNLHPEKDDRNQSNNLHPEKKLLIPHSLWFPMPHLRDLGPKPGSTSLSQRARLNFAYLGGNLFLWPVGFC
ncbi:hypothetical protein GJAV_G00085390 [Gymnothorax javanicus]|nr:hypothetical protein GJAV_G00085390 [Gymnothorax javanicus]